MKRLAIATLVGLLATAGCTDRLLEPETTPKVQESVDGGLMVASMSLGMAGRSNSLRSPALDDIATRLLPGFSDEVAADAVGALLVSLDAALVAEDVSAARDAIAAARAVLVPNGVGSSSTVNDSAEIGVILLILEQIEQNFLSN